MAVEFWAWVRAEQQARGLSATDCAERAGMTQSGWSRYMNEPSSEPRRSTIRKVAKGLGISYEEVERMAGKKPALGSDSEKAHLGDRLRTFRMRIGWTQEQVADRLGIGRTTYNQYEQGIIEASALMLKRIADLFGVPVGSFFHKELILPEGGLAPDEGPEVEPAVLGEKAGLHVLLDLNRQIVENNRLVLENNRTLQILLKEFRQERQREGAGV